MKVGWLHSDSIQVQCSQLGAYCCQALNCHLSKLNRDGQLQFTKFRKPAMLAKEFQLGHVQGLCFNDSSDHWPFQQCSKNALETSVTCKRDLCGRNSKIRVIVLEGMETPDSTICVGNNLAALSIDCLTEIWVNSLMKVSMAWRSSRLSRSISILKYVCHSSVGGSFSIDATKETVIISGHCERFTVPILLGD